MRTRDYLPMWWSQKSRNASERRMGVRADSGIPGLPGVSNGEAQVTFRFA